jgi:NitT/TauT family transport system substrate-binding protein
MEVYQVKVFLEVARHLSFTEAADALNLTQPAVSAKIKSLETELGTLLFHRLGRKIQLTEVGQFLYTECPKLIEVEAQLIKKVEEIKKGKFGCLRIGSTAAISEGWLPEILFAYRKQYPSIQTNCIVFESTEFLYHALTSQQIDIGISDISLADFSEISASAIDTIQYSLVVSASHPLASKAWLGMSELQNYPWVLLPDGSSSRLMLEARLVELGLTLADFSHIETADTLSLMRTYLLQGNYLGFASQFEFIIERQLGLLVTIPLQEFALPSSVFLFTSRRHSASADVLTNRASRSHSPSPVQKFIDLVQSSPRSASAIPNDLPRLPMCLRSPSLTILSTTLHRPETITLSIGVQNNTIPTITAGLVMQKLGLLEHFLPREGRYINTRYEIHWQDYLTGAPIIQGLHNGQLAIGVLGDYPLLLSALPSTETADSKRTRLVSFVATNPDGSCNAVIVPHQSKLQSLTDLRGGVIAVPFSSSAHGMVMRSLNTANLLSHVRLASLEATNSNQLFDGLPLEVDGYAHFAPFHDIACYRGKFRYLSYASPEQLPAFHGVVVSEDLAEKHPDIIIAYLKALQAAQYWYDVTASASSLVSQWTNLEAEIVLRILNGSYCKTQPGRFFSEMTIRPDWVHAHINELKQIPGNELLSEINLDTWIQPEFLHAIQS